MALRHHLSRRTFLKGLGLSGATITSKGVGNLLQFWLSEHGYGPYLAAYRSSRSDRTERGI